jgi:hypothetical protein
VIDAWKYGRWPGSIGRHFVMPRVIANGAVVYGVWVVRTRNRMGDGNGELLAEFRSKIFANRWCRARNAERFDRKVAKQQLRSVP